MSSFWVFESFFVCNNNLLMAEAFITHRREELLAAMGRFFAVPRTEILLAEVLGVYFVDDGRAEQLWDAKPFVKVAIAGRELRFDEPDELLPLIGDLEGRGIDAAYLAQGRSPALESEDELDDDDFEDEDDDDLVLHPFRLLFDAEGFARTLPDLEGTPGDPPYPLMRPVDAPGWPADYPAYFFERPVPVGTGWWNVEPDSPPRPFSEASRFVENLEVPLV